ncbi:MAG: PAS domain-containing protein [Coxiellaceae bacterium]|nr:PAS domain-containing protein [Coxiellaceae bacterium]
MAMRKELIEQQMLSQMPLGVMLLNKEGEIVSWNQWLELKTTISEKHAQGKQITELFSQSSSPRFTWAFEMVLKHGMSQVLSQVLNHYLIPIKVLGMEPYGLPYMQQHIELMPVEDDNKERFVMVCIMDVTMNVVKASHAIESADNLVFTEDIDHATTLYNRRYLWQWLRHQFVLAGRLSYSISSIMIEVDANDYVLETINTMMRKLVEVIIVPLRRSDCMMRFDDRHIIVLLPSCEHEDAVMVAQKLQDLVGKEKTLPPCYYGTATWSAAKPCTSEELVKMLAQSLKKSKAAAKKTKICSKD